MRAKMGNGALPILVDQGQKTVIAIGERLPERSGGGGASG